MEGRSVVSIECGTLPLGEAPHLAKEARLLPSRVREQSRANKRRSLLEQTGRLDLLQRLTTHLAHAPEAVLFEAALEAMKKGLDLPSAAVLTCINGPMKFRAWHSLSASYRDAVKGHSPWADNDRAPAPILVSDAMRNTRLVDYRDLFQDEGIGALAFLPIVDDGLLIGKFMLYNGDPRDWTDSDIAFGQVVASLVALILRRTLVAETLRSSTVGLTTLAQHLPIGVVFTDASGRIQFCNKPFLDTVGVSMEESVIGQQVEQVAKKHRKVIDPVAFLSRVHEIIRLGIATPGEDLHLRGGKVLEQMYCPVRAGGEVVGHLWSYRDVTEQREMERQLLQGEEMESLSLLAGGMAHHFNSLLMSIFEYSAIAQKDPEPDRLSLPFLEQLIRVAGQAADITRQLNTLSARKPDHAKALDQARGPDQKKMFTVLVVEDECLVREVLCEALNAKGYRVIAFANAVEALAGVTEGQEFDLLVTDAAMPGMTGIELIHEVRQHHPGTKALLISGYVGDRSAGDEDLPFLQKPFMPEEFAQRVAGILNDPLRRFNQ